MKSPCLICHRRYLSKDHPECESCQKRLAYLGSLGGHYPDPIFPAYAGHNQKEQAPMETAREKVCSHSKCRHQGQPQPLAEFYKNKQQSDGRDYYCKECRKRNFSPSAPPPARVPASDSNPVKWIIDKDIPIPPAVFIRLPRLQLPFDQMQPGHSVLVDADLISKNYKHREAFRNSVVKQARVRGLKAATRRIGQDVRVWLVDAR